METGELFELAKKFKIEGEPISVDVCSEGHINKTYAITYQMLNGAKEKYILQYVNTNVFPNLPELMKNIKNVTSYIIKKAKEKGEPTDRLTINLIDTKDNSPYCIYNENWRMENFIENTKTYLTTEDLNVLFEAGSSIGNFQKYLDGFPADELFEIIPKFHDTPNRVKQLKQAIESEKNRQERKERFDLASKAIEIVLDEKRLYKTDLIVNKIKNKQIPLRVTHNDTKLSNILFDKDTNKAVCLIDLDTVMPGALAYDFGEGLRTGIVTTKEDEQDLSKINVDLERFKAYTKGFLSELKETITSEEIKTLVLGIWMMTYENAIRFLADYLNGDVYFNIDSKIPNHNLVRAKAHLEILRQLEEKEDEMEEIIEELLK